MVFICIYAPISFAANQISTRIGIPASFAKAGGCFVYSYVRSCVKVCALTSRSDIGHFRIEFEAAKIRETSMSSKKWTSMRDCEGPTRKVTGAPLKRFLNSICWQQGRNKARGFDLPVASEGKCRRH
jgi:hypothetical protein